MLNEFWGEEEIGKRVREAGRSRRRRKKKEHSFAVIEAAENLYIYRQKTYEEVSKITGIPLRTIQKWSKSFEWRKKRVEHVKRRVEYRKNLYDLRDKILGNALETGDPQIIHALVNLQKMIEAEERMKPIEDISLDPGKNLGLSEETLKRIREEVYGIYEDKKMHNPKSEIRN